MTGKTDTEDAFLENFRLFDGFGYQPYQRTISKGMVPMCYPSDLSGGQFIE